MRAHKRTDWSQFGRNPDESSTPKAGKCGRKLGSSFCRQLSETGGFKLDGKVVHLVGGRSE